MLALTISLQAADVHHVPDRAALYLLRGRQLTNIEIAGNPLTADSRHLAMYSQLLSAQ